MQTLSGASFLSDNIWQCSPWEINKRVQEFKSLPDVHVHCNWVTEMKKVSLEAVEMDLRLKLSDFSRR